MGIALSTLHEAIHDWVDDQMRIDIWTIDPPVGLGTQVNTILYPANTVYLAPAKNIDFLRSDFGLECTATFPLKITYRFSKLVPFDALPITECEGLLNNLYFEAMENPADISEDIREIFTDEERGQVVVGNFNDADSDWMIQISPAFRMRFKPARALLPNLQPTPVAPIIPITRLDIGIYRAKAEFQVGNAADYRLDRTIRLN